MNTKSTIVWGVAADGTGIVHNVYSGQAETLPGGGVRVERRSLLAHEPASDYARSHASPMPMLWQHGEEIGRIVALRRAHGNLYAIGRSDLNPAELQSLAGERGLKWSTGTNTRRSESLRIVEISPTPEPATVGLPPVSWWKSDTSRGDPPWWVRKGAAPLAWGAPRPRARLGRLRRVRARHGRLQRGSPRDLPPSRRSDRRGRWPPGPMRAGWWRDSREVDDMTRIMVPGVDPMSKGAIAS